MHEEQITIQESSLLLEGMLTRQSGSRGLIMAHPHPLYGGNMDNPVVTTVTKTFAKAGYTTLRFNFRGVGNSQGTFAEGQGEIDDLMAARGYLAAMEMKEITLAGYSFGVWVIVNAAAAEKVEDNPLLFISPPAAVLPFATALELPDLKLVITGERDEIAPPQAVGKLRKNWNPEADLSIIKDCNHFFANQLQNLTTILNQQIIQPPA